MSLNCTKQYTMVVGSVGPPHGPVKLDAATVSAMNAYSTYFGSAMVYSGVLNWDGGQWAEYQSDAPGGYGLTISPFRSPSLYFVLAPIAPGGGVLPGDMSFFSDSLAIAPAGLYPSAFPVGVWNSINWSPAGFTHPPSGFPFPGGSTITTTWA